MSHVEKERKAALAEEVRKKQLEMEMERRSEIRTKMEKKERLLV